MFENRLIEILKSNSVSSQKIDDTIDSGYIIRNFLNPFTYKTVEAVSDRMFGNKIDSSCFDVGKFIEYIHGEYDFPPLRKVPEYTVKNIDDINKVLSDKKRQYYLKEGQMSFRGQTSQYKYKRKVPSPVRSDKEGNEISILPGIFRQNSDFYSINETPPRETHLLEYFLSELEPNNPEVYLDSKFAYDPMRVEQHYINHTAGLDISFDVETAIFFATYRFNLNSNGKAFYDKILRGNHNGVIYGFRFLDPLVKKSEFLIADFDLFKTYKPERIIRQYCGLPLFDEYGRNMVITDLDFIIYLDKDFEYEGVKTPEYMFPNIEEDKFYGKLLELKDRSPDLLANIVEYEGCRV